MDHRGQLHTQCQAQECTTDMIKLAMEHDIALSSVDIAALVTRNVHYSGVWNVGLLKKYSAYKEMLEKVALSTEKPLVGHRVKVVATGRVDRDVKVYNKAILCKQYYWHDQDKLSLCVEPSAHIQRLELDSAGMDLSVSGGYFKMVDTDQLTLVDVVPAVYWFWGDRPCAQGGIYITTDMARWTIQSDDFY